MITKFIADLGTKLGSSHVFNNLKDFGLQYGDVIFKAYDSITPATRSPEFSLSINSIICSQSLRNLASIQYCYSIY